VGGRGAGFEYRPRESASRHLEAFTCFRNAGEKQEGGWLEEHALATQERGEKRPDREKKTTRIELEDSAEGFGK